MTIDFGDAKDVLERILNSYGVKSRPELAELLHIPLPTINNWVARGSVPGNYVIQCSLETKADLQWLVSGELKNVSSPSVTDGTLHGKELYDLMLASGGKAVLRRILDAYGFTMQKQLGDLLDIASGTMSAWVRRDYFPGDVVVACALDTGVSLRWLATGKGAPGEKAETPASNPIGLRKLNKYKLNGGSLDAAGEWWADSSLLSSDIKQPAFIEKGAISWIVDLGAESVSNGLWILDIDGNKDIYQVVRIPGNRIKVSDSKSEFECSTEDVKPVGMVTLTLTKNS
ncbi:helix-turn-helix domain-containing protein [Erwiniaceae bacterium BAC15a-03b]|uniref:Helix-turn-helix domain-containing protein n=1 Tax=Winslowiella arboricola TaxID=2978220 RepID=A0A9J6PQ46_9GAMM|nr:phage repressor protein CI [Winslowiella arboricola]MCU5773100.1 helix-turn-helix domain-containing protein [Winslowiella arboricola]MCU5777805.1 helix-turn-helix domain-containing protein [Winslowiella arboricola]